MNIRRTFLGHLASAALMPFLPAQTSAAPRLSRVEDLNLIPILRKFIPNNSATHRLAAAALRQYKSSPDGSVATLGKLFAEMTKTSPPTTYQVRAHLQSLRDADFATGNTVNLDGWILARSEVEAITLVALHWKI